MWLRHAYTVSYYFYLNRKHRYCWYLLSYMLGTINTLPYRSFIKNCNNYTSMTQLRFCMALSRVIFIHCLYLAKLNPVLCIGLHSSVGRALGRWSGDRWFEPAERHYFYSNNIRLLPYVLTGGDPQLQWLNRNESNRVLWIWDKILIFSAFVSC